MHVLERHKRSILLILTHNKSVSHRNAFSQENMVYYYVIYCIRTEMSNCIANVYSV